MSRNNGAITVEAAITLPVFICVLVSIIFLIKVVYVQEIIQHALSETVDEMAASSYIYHISGLQEIHDSVRDGMESRAELSKGHLSTVINSYNDLGSLFSTAGEIAENPMDELKSIASLISEGVFEDVKTELCIPVVRLYMKKYLNSAQSVDVEKRLQNLNIVSGFNGLDFSKSSFFEDDDNDIDIVVRYKMSVPVPFKIFPKLLIVQRATARAWLGGDRDNEAGQLDREEDVWSLDNLQRGNRIRTVFGENLPYNFPVISRFDSGIAVMIKSMDLTAASYQDRTIVKEQITGYIKILAVYRGQEEPWGSKGIVIGQKDIREKRLILVIPKNPVSPQIKLALDECVTFAGGRGVTMAIEEYGLKRTTDKNMKPNDN